MRRIEIAAPGGYERLVLVEEDDPAPGPGEVAIAVVAAGVNYADCVVRMGLYSSAKKYVGWPITPGFEVAGRVAAVGPGVDDLEPGARVCAVTRFGGYTSFLVVPRSQVFQLPPQLPCRTAASLLAVGLTAWYALDELARPRPGETVLVHSAAGGVGGSLVQLAKLRGCRVVGVVGASHKVEPLRALGADAIVDKSRESLWEAARRHAPEGYAAVFDANGVSTLKESYRHLRPTGRLVVYGFHSMLPRQGGRPRWLKLAWDWLRTPRFDPLAMTSDNKSVMAFNLSYLFDRQDLLREALGKFLPACADGRFRPLPISCFPLEEVARAHQALESGQTVGKLVLVMDGEDDAPEDLPES